MLNVKSYKLKKGFTLLELLLVIAIIASLAGIILMALNPAQRLEEANEVKSLSNAKDIEKALNAYVVEHNGQYPAELQTYFNQGATTVSICKEGEDCVGAELTELISGEYINNMPVNTGYDTTEKSGYDVILGEGGISIGGVYGTPTFLLRDDFTTADAAPLNSPRTAEPGPGSWTITDTANYLSIDGQKLIVSGGTTTVFNPRLNSSTLTRISGRTVVFTATPLNSRGPDAVGWLTSASGENYAVAMRFVNNDLRYGISAGTGPIIGSYIDNTTYTMATILRNIGGFVAKKNLLTGLWSLEWVSNLGNTSPIYPTVQYYAGTSQLNTFRILDLPAPFNDDHGIATQRLAGSVTQGTTFNHEADSIIEYTVDTLPTASLNLRFRKQDDSNNWQIRISSGGSISLWEVVGGTATSISNVVGVVSNGHRVVIISDGTTIRVYSNNILRITHNSASNFTTATSAVLYSLGSGGVVSNLVSYPRQLTGSAAAALDKATE